MKLGDIINGDEVVAILRSYVYCHFCKITPDSLHPWDREHPGWRLENVVMLKLPEPRVTLTFKEFLAIQTEALPLEVLRQQYDKMPKAEHLWVPSVALA